MKLYSSTINATVSLLNDKLVTEALAQVTEFERRDGLTCQD